MEQKYIELITKEFEDCIINTVKRLKSKTHNYPFHTALLSREILFWSRFERSFSTSFGQKAIERISEYAALVGGATEAKTQYESRFSLPVSQLNAIDSHINNLRSGRQSRAVNWNDDISSIQDIEKDGGDTQLRVISDLWWVKNGKNNFMSIKTVKPNIDQTAEAKRDLLKLQVHDPSCGVYFGLYYNPYGENRADYSHTQPMGIFNFHNDPVVLIGQDYWDTLGGEGFYNKLLAIAEECGNRTRSYIEKEYIYED